MGPEVYLVQGLGRRDLKKNLVLRRRTNRPQTGTFSFSAVNPSLIYESLGKSASVDFDIFTWHRLGDTMHIHGNFRHSASFGADSAKVLLVNLPTGYEIDSNKIIFAETGTFSNSFGHQTVGHGIQGVEALGGGSTTAVYHAWVVPWSKNYLAFWVGGRDVSPFYLNSNLYKVSTTFALAFNAFVPIKGWH